MERFAPHVDFFMISGSEELLPRFKELSNKYRCLFNVSLAERGSVTYFNGQEFKVQAVKVESIIDTTGCGDSYHAGLVGATPTAYGGSQARGLIGAVATSLHHSHSNARSFTH